LKVEWGNDEGEEKQERDQLLVLIRALTGSEQCTHIPWNRL